MKKGKGSKVGSDRDAEITAMDNKICYCFVMLPLSKLLNVIIHLGNLFCAFLPLLNIFFSSPNLSLSRSSFVARIWLRPTQQHTHSAHAYRSGDQEPRVVCSDTLAIQSFHLRSIAVQFNLVSLLLWWQVIRGCKTILWNARFRNWLSWKWFLGSFDST